MASANPLYIEIRNFGPIKEFRFNLKEDFVLIVGENNIGKSYAISLVYLTLKALTAIADFVYPYGIYERYMVGKSSSDEWLKQFEQAHTSDGFDQDIQITDSVKSHLQEFVMTILLPIFRNSMQGTFNDIKNLQNQLSDEPMTLVLSTSSVKITFQLDEDLTISDVDLQGHSFYVRKVKQNRTFLEYLNSTIIYFPQENPSQFEGNYQALISRIFGRFIAEFTNEISALHYLPASRSGLYQALSAFGQIVAELAKNRTLLTRKIELPGISEPLSDYFLKLSEVRPSNVSEANLSFYQIAERIEKEILLGTVDFDTKTKRITYKPNNTKLELDLSATSSMVSEISPIVSYLKFVLPRGPGLKRRKVSSREAHQKQVIIIEEPEAHLHPDVQSKLVSVFAELVKKAGIKLIMTSHSNYVFNKVSNLVIGKEIDPETFRAILFKRTEGGSIAEDLEVTELGIFDKNFVDTGEKIYQERLELFQNKNK